MGKPYDAATFLQAIVDDDLRTVSLFLRAGMDPNTRSRGGDRREEGEDALLMALSTGDVALVKVLLAAGARHPDSSGGNNRALDRAAARDDEPSLRLLLEKPASVSALESAVLAAGQSNAVHTLAILLKRTTPTAATLGQALRDNANTQFVGAGSERHLQNAVPVAQLLLAAGAHVDAADDDGWTALHHASKNGRDGLVRLLLEAHADVNRLCACPGYLQGTLTPLHLATIQHHDSTVAALLAAGADVHAASADGTTALLFAIDEGEPVNVIERLLAAGATFGEATADGSGAVLHAVHHPTVLKFLLDHGANPNAVGPHGLTPLLLATSLDEPDAIRVLLDAGAELEVRSEKGNTPLLAAVLGASLESARLLLERGARRDARNAEGATALMLVREIEDQDTRSRMQRLLTQKEKP